MQLFVLAVFLLGIFQSQAQDATKCGLYPTCHECISHNLCGWCGVPVVYSDGTTGPHCAGKPEDPNNPPPGYKPWTCPSDFQNDKCYGYICNDNFQCVSSGSPGKGVPLADCQKQCIPPTYECNRTTTVCYQVLPGHGTDKQSCEAQCQAPPTTTTGPQPQTPPGPEGPPSPQSINNKYSCNLTTLKCELVENGGIPLSDCNQVCGAPNNVTPVFVIGEYRGLEINKGYMKGEWQARITADAIVIVDPTGKVWKKGVVRSSNNELWLVDTNTNEVFKGIYSITQVPELQVLTWGLSAPGSPAPSSFDDAMTNGVVMVLGKCLVSPTCSFHIFQAVERIARLHKSKQNKFNKPILEKRDVSQVVNDPCSKYPDCSSCIKAPEFCGWCSVPILYNSTIPGKNCAGLNVTITPRINCTGIFSTEDCSQQTTASTTDTDTSGEATGTAGPVDNLYTCDPVSGTCTQGGDGGQPKDVCDAQCKTTPVVPPVLQNTLFRGLQIDNAYVPGEWRAKFTTTDVTIVDPNGNILVANVSTTAQFMTLTFMDGSNRQTLWQLTTGASSQFLSWAWGSPNDQPPVNFDDAMTSQNGKQVHWFQSCLPNKPRGICDFSQ